MEQRTCPVCRQQFTPTHHNQVYCPPTKAKGKGQARSACARRAMNVSYRSDTEQAECKRCGQSFERTRGTSQHVYCSDECHHEEKAERYAAEPCEHGADHRNCPACTFLARAEGSVNWRETLRADPCAYCGITPANGIDHIDCTNPDRSDRENWTACCKRCNELKRTVPLLLALPWIPTTREYHRQRRLLFG
jgi:hypothetical protein